VVAKEFERELQFVSPPRWLQKGLFSVLAPIGRARGDRAIDPRYLEPARRRPVGWGQLAGWAQSRRSTWRQKASTRAFHSSGTSWKG
jgi:hypothetical protein